MNRICEIVNEFTHNLKEEELNSKKIEIEQKHNTELNLQYYEHIYNTNNHSYYYYRINYQKLNSYILYLYFRNGKLMHMSVKIHGKVLCKKDF